MSNRSIIYIDSWNVYHGLLKRYKDFRWIDIQKYCQMWRLHDDIIKVYYFTAITPKKPETAKMQLGYHKALKTTPLVEVVCGNFVRKDILCKVRKCTYDGNREFKRLTERKTDVNIASCLIYHSLLNHCDYHIIVSNDIDLVPAIQMIKAQRREQKVFIYVPVDVTQEKRKVNRELVKEAHRCETLPLHLFKRSFFPDTIISEDGEEIKKPDIW